MFKFNFINRKINLGVQLGTNLIDNVHNAELDNTWFSNLKSIKNIVALPLDHIHVAHDARNLKEYLKYTSYYFFFTLISRVKWRRRDRNQHFVQIKFEPIEK